MSLRTPASRGDGNLPSMMVRQAVHTAIPRVCNDTIQAVALAYRRIAIDLGRVVRKTTTGAVARMSLRTPASRGDGDPPSMIVRQVVHTAIPRVCKDTIRAMAPTYPRTTDLYRIVHTKRVGALAPMRPPTPAGDGNPPSMVVRQAVPMATPRVCNDTIPAMAPTYPRITGLHRIIRMTTTGPSARMQLPTRAKPVDGKPPHPSPPTATLKVRNDAGAIRAVLKPALALRVPQEPFGLSGRTNGCFQRFRTLPAQWRNQGRRRRCGRAHPVVDAGSVIAPFRCLTASQACPIRRRVHG